MTQTQIKYVPTNLVKSSPYQARTGEDPAHIQGIADSFLEHAGQGEKGMLEVPMGRELPSGEVELAFGMSRFAAWKLVYPDEPFPVFITQADDRKMADLGATENARRKNLSPIETARAIERRKKDFKLTNAEAGKVFGYANESSVSRLLQLLKLPEEVQTLVDQRKMPERNARALVPLQRVAPGAVVKIAQASLKADNPEELIDDRIETVLREKAVSLSSAPWEFDWPIAALPLEHAIDDLTNIPPCKGCGFLFAHHGNSYCGRPECFDAKLNVKMPEVLAAGAQRFGIPVAEPSEKTTLVYNGRESTHSWDFADKVKHALRVKQPELRLMPLYTRDADFQREQVLGSNYLVLGTVDVAATKKWVEERERPKTPKAAAPKENESETAKAKRVAEEKRVDQEKRKARAAVLKNKWDVIWLVKNATMEIAKLIVLDGEISAFFDNLVQRHFPINHAELCEWDHELEKTAYDKSRSDAERVTARKARIILRLVAEKSTDYQGHCYPVGQAHAWIEALCRPYSAKPSEYGHDQHVGVKLPGGWDKIPVQHLPCCCWKCGTFAPGEKLTKRDLGDGWVQGKDKDVYCPRDRGILGKAAKGHAVVKKPQS